MRAWDVVGALASIIAIFAFVTGMTTLARLVASLKGFSRRIRELWKRPHPTAQERNTVTYNLVSFALLLRVFCIAVLVGSASFFLQAPESDWLPAPLYSAAPLERFICAATVALGLAFVVDVWIHYKRNEVTYETLGIALLLPTFTGLMSLFTIFENLHRALALVAGFVGFGGAVSFLLIAVGEFGFAMIERFSS